MAKRLLVVRDPQWQDGALLEVLGAGPWVMKLVAPHEYETVLTLDRPDVIAVLSAPDLLLARRVLTHVGRLDDHLPVVVLLAQEGPVSGVVECMKAGAHDVFVWPIASVRLVKLLEHAAHLYQLTRRVFLLEQHAGGWSSVFDDMVGHGLKMQEVFQLIKTVAPSNATVLITGESGTGKELVARALHRHSARAAGRFLDLNCGAIPQALLENELFGHERGAYTGAERRYQGMCECADRGTLFLDEICEMPATLQVKILRLLQERTFTRVGSTEQLKVDLRFIAATNREVLKEVEEGRFREDLYYRLNVVPIHLPALRERPEDIGPLAGYFMEKGARRLEKPFIDIAPDAIEVLAGYRWPGNVRELENVMERVIVLHNDTRVKLKHLPPQIQAGPRRIERAKTSPPMLDTESILPLDLVEKYAIEAALEKCTGNVHETAKRLKIGQATLYRKIRQYGLRH